jgi:hypothetical protein
MPRKTTVPEGHEGLSMRASNVLWNAGLRSKEDVVNAVIGGVQIETLRQCGRATAQEIFDWVELDQEIIQPKWNVVSPGRVKIGRWVLTRSQVLAILAAMD